jgi:hypothetical protein
MNTTKFAWIALAVVALVVLIAWQFRRRAAERWEKRRKIGFLRETEGTETPLGLVPA